jgi:hypothetical protein
MTTYRISAPHFVAGIVASGDLILQAAPILSWAVGRDFGSVRDYCQRKGWQIEPVLAPRHPTWLELHGSAYELRWDGNRISSVVLHEDGEEKEMTFNELPDELKELL